MRFCEGLFDDKIINEKNIPVRYWEDPKSFYHLYLKSHAGTFYSQAGEDILTLLKIRSFCA